MENKQGQSGGMITGLIFGVASLVIGVIIALVIVSTLSNADLLEADRLAAYTVTNESFNGVTQGVWLNATTYTLANGNTTTQDFVITQVWNQTGAGDGTGDAGGVVPTTNYTVVASTGVITNSTPAFTYDNVTVSYTYNYYNGESLEEVSTGYMSGNLTSGIDKVSAKLPTVLLIAAIVLILTVLAVLVGVWQKMRMGGGGI